MRLRQAPRAGDGFAVLAQAEDGRIRGVGRHPDRLLLVRPMQGGSRLRWPPRLSQAPGDAVDFRCENSRRSLIQRTVRAIRPW